MIYWIKERIGERTSWDGAVCIALGLMILFMAPLAKIAAGLAIVEGAGGKYILKDSPIKWSFNVEASNGSL